MGNDSALATIRWITMLAGIPVGQNTKYDNAETIRQNATGMFSMNSMNSMISGKITISALSSFRCLLPVKRFDITD